MTPTIKLLDALALVPVFMVALALWFEWLRRRDRSVPPGDEPAAVPEPTSDPVPPVPASAIELEGTLLGDMLAVTVVRLGGRSVLLPGLPWDVQAGERWYAVQVMRSASLGRIDDDMSAGVWSGIDAPVSAGIFREPLGQPLRASTALVVSGVETEEQAEQIVEALQRAFNEAQ